MPTVAAGQALIMTVKDRAALRRLALFPTSPAAG